MAVSDSPVAPSGEGGRLGGAKGGGGLGEERGRATWWPISAGREVLGVWWLG